MEAVMNSKEIIVSISLGNQDVRVGKLWFHVRGSKENASFEYEYKQIQRYSNARIFTKVKHSGKIGNICLEPLPIALAKL
jgi:hypothetical protein